MEDRPKEILELERALGIDHVVHYRWDGGKVTELVILNKKISNKEPLKKFNDLRSLDLGGNNISDLSPIRELKDLKTLGASVNNIKEISFLTSISCGEIKISEDR